MTYFKIISIIMGLVSVGVRPLMHLIPQAWNDFELNKVYKEEQPKWLWALGIFSVAVVSFTWYKELTTDVDLSLILTLVITATIIKTSQLLFNYHNFRKLVQKVLVEDRAILVKINIASTILGIVLLFLGFFVY